MLRALLTLVTLMVRSAVALFRTREKQAIMELALRQQLAVYVHRHPRPRLSPLDRAFWVALTRFWPDWRNALVVVRPETVIRWHRQAFRGYWRWISKPGPGRPPNRLFKLPALETRCEDYGQVAIYRGGIPHHEALFALDDHHFFERGRPERVCGNTAEMLGATRLRERFTLTGDRATHYGLFDCAGTLATALHAQPVTPSSASCC